VNENIGQNQDIKCYEGIYPQNVKKRGKGGAHDVGL